MTLCSAAPFLHARACRRTCTHMCTLASHHTDKSVSMRSVFIALVPPHFCFFCHSFWVPSVCWGRFACTSYDAGVFVYEAQTKIHRNIAIRHSSHLLMQYEWNTSCTTGELLDRWWLAGKDLSRDLYSPDKEMERLDSKGKTKWGLVGGSKSQKQFI